MTTLRDFHGPNAGYILELYERYRQDPDSVDPATQDYFEQWRPSMDGATSAAGPAVAADTQTVVGVANLAQAIREYGHLAAELDLLGSLPPDDPALEMAYHGLSRNELEQLPASVIGGPIADETETAQEAIQALRRIYSDTTGYDYDHLREPVEREWLRHAAECRRFRPTATSDDYVALLEQLTEVEALEHFLHRSFPGKTRFSIEGLDMMVPMLTEIVSQAAEAYIYTILLGMAHRGRLNVLAHVLQKSYKEILAEFKDPFQERTTTMSEYLGWTGDVKYHQGGLRAIAEDEAERIVISMAPNPSHLEYINPVVIGMSRAAGSRVDQPGPPRFETDLSLSILIHGDASFTGQGVVAETLNFHRLPGYRVGGTIHIIANNQLGFTAESPANRSTLYASDLAKGFKIPVVHVNADDPVACLEAARLAFAYQHEFHKDFVIDLIGYRRYGHNEGDEPRFTQPLMYQIIDDHPSVREQWATTLVEQDLIEAEAAEEIYQRRIDHLQTIMDELAPEEDLPEPQLEPPPPGAARNVATGVELERLRRLNQALLELPEDFNLNSKIERAMKRRRQALAEPDEARVDWATAEALALASILEEGIAIRLTGEDSERGTFSHRHAVFYDVETGDTFTPLQSIPQAKAAFEIRNSPLSENGALGFEYGYNIQAPDRLVIWEAQYGDFINGAQAMVDEFVVSGRAKWEQTPSLVMLLPHGYEGQGPDHSTGRLERFLQLAAEINIRVANCSTAAQYFHLLRRQAMLLETDPLPLIVMTPKSLLRNPLAASTPQELAKGRWQPVIDDALARQRPEQVRRLILCSGKIYVDLIDSEARDKSPGLAIARIEQLYPLLPEAVQPLWAGYPNLAEVVWVQEEPRNMGAWRSLKPQLSSLLDGRWPLRCIARPRRASPAEGSSAWHTATQQKLIEQAYDLDDQDSDDQSE